MSVDATLAEWLKAPALYAEARAAAVEGAWGDRAIDSEIISALADRAAAEAEAAGQLAVLAGPLAVDRHVVDGQRRDLLGRAIDVVGGSLDAGAVVRGFVIRVDEADGNFTVIDVLRRLA